MDSYGEATRTIIKTEYGQNVYVSQNVSNISSENVSIHDGAVIKIERESPESQHSRYQRADHREHYRARSRDKRYNDDRRAFRREKERKDTNKSYDESQQREFSRGSTERSRGRKQDDHEIRHKDNYSSRGRSRNYDEHQKEQARDRNPEKTYDGDDRSLFSDYSSRYRSKNYRGYVRDIQSEHDIKMEKVSEESESYTGCNRDLNRNRSKGKEHHDPKVRSEKYQKRHSPTKVIKKEREISTDLSNNITNSESSRKRGSTSKERRHKDKKRRRDKDKHSSKRDREHDSRRRKHDGSPE